MITKEQYLADPCRVASIPYWKAKIITIPDGMKILHQNNFDESEYPQYIDEAYFRLSHDLQGLSAPVLPDGFSLCDADIGYYASHINRCYADIGITAAELQSYTTHPVYNADLWLAVKDDKTGVIVATGIAELDREIGEGVLEWIQVSEQYRGHGLGCYIVSELLWRMKDKAGFATVSGQCSSQTNPERLYRKCGFTGDDVWHILRKKISELDSFKNITLELLSEQNIDAVRAIHREDIIEAWVDTVDTLMELTQYGLEHNCIGHTYAVKCENAYIGVILLGEAIPWESDPQEMDGVPFYRLMGFVIDNRYRGCGIGGHVLELVIKTIYEEFGARPIALGVHKNNYGAERFYEKHGFEKTDAMEGNDIYYLRYPEK